MKKLVEFYPFLFLAIACAFFYQQNTPAGIGWVAAFIFAAIAESKEPKQ